MLLVYFAEGCIYNLELGDLAILRLCARPLRRSGMRVVLGKILRIPLQSIGPSASNQATVHVG